MIKNARTAQVRQLEALVRVSEALSKMRLSAEVSSRDVREVSTSSEHLCAPDAHAHSPDAQALRLFKASTMTAASGGHSSHGAGGGALAAGGGGGGLLRPGTAAEMERAEEFVAQRIAIGMRVSARVVQEEARAQGHPSVAVTAAILAMVQRRDLKEESSARMLRRLK